MRPFKPLPTKVIIGGFMPLIATTLLKAGGGAPWYVAGFLVAVALLSAVCAYLVSRHESEVPRDASGRDLASDEFRNQLIWQLERWCADPEAPWRDKIAPFFERVWPKQRALHTPAMSWRLANFALMSGDLMPRVVELILPRLVPIRHASLLLDAAHRAGERTPALDHPRAVLDLLWAILGEDASLWPYRVEDSLETLAQDPEMVADPRLSELRRRLELR